KVGDWLRNSSVDVGYSSTDPVTKVAQDRSDEDEKSEASVCSYDISKGSMDGVLVVKCDSGRTRAYKQNERGSWEVAGGIGAIPASNLFESIDDAAKTWCRCD
ncbi:MAG: hypothetical protein MI919_40825, partial [Holophagales bacterium]|nr:hypothetical protein [Holophagales bacterium]